MQTLPKEYVDDMLVRLAHHSSALEGNTITLSETISIILHNQVNSNRSVDLREVYEVKNHEQTLYYMLESLQENKPISVHMIKEIHALLMDRLQYDRGQFKSIDNAIIGADFMTASVQETPLLMQQWVDNIHYRLDVANTYIDKIDAISESHIEFERIHPFADGNGRTGRMVLNYLLLANNLPALIIESKERATYLAFLAEQDTFGFSKFIAKSLETESERLQRFKNMEQAQIKHEE